MKKAIYDFERKYDVQNGLLNEGALEGLDERTLHETVKAMLINTIKDCIKYENFMDPDMDEIRNILFKENKTEEDMRKIKNEQDRLRNSLHFAKVSENSLYTLLYEMLSSDYIKQCFKQDMPELYENLYYMVDMEDEIAESLTFIFAELYEAPIVKDNDEWVLKKLKMLIEPFILRRTKQEVLTELPDKTISVLNNEMQDEQLKIYTSYMANAKREVSQELKENGFEKSQMKILALLMRLRQICCHPSLFISNYTGESSKLNQCIEVIKDAVLSGHKILLFSSYSSMLEIIGEELKKENIKHFKLTGQTKVGDRLKLVEEFNSNDEIKVFLISLKAGGTVLNLIGADMVIHYDPWWNLSAENQATDRTYRIGQKKNVQVYKLITKDSIEERIYELQEKKAQLAKSMLSTDTTFINKLSREDIMSLFD